MMVAGAAQPVAKLDRGKSVGGKRSEIQNFPGGLIGLIGVTRTFGTRECGWRRPRGGSANKNSYNGRGAAQKTGNHAQKCHRGKSWKRRGTKGKSLNKYAGKMHLSRQLTSN